MNWNFFRPTKKKAILLVFLLLTSLFVFYSSFVVTSGSFVLFKVKVIIAWVFLFPVLLTLQTSNSGNISYWILVIPLQFLYLYLLSCILLVKPSYRKIIAYTRARWTAILIAAFALPIVVWLIIVPPLSFKFTLGLQLFTAIPVILVSFIGYKFIEYLFKLPRLKIWFMIILFMLGYAIASGVFYALPTCGYSRSGWGSESQECECSGIKITLDTSFAFDAYSTKTVCIGSGYPGDKTNMPLNAEVGTR